jgi:hypothetical protein
MIRRSHRRVRRRPPAGGVGLVLLIVAAAGGTFWFVRSRPEERAAAGMTRPPAEPSAPEPPMPASPSGDAVRPPAVPAPEAQLRGPALSPYTPDELASAEARAAEQAARCRFDRAADELDALDDRRIPQDARGAICAQAERYRTMHALLRLTEFGAVRPAPPIHAFVFRATGQVQYGEILAQDDLSVTWRALSGAVVSLARADLQEAPSPLPAYQVPPVLVEEITRRAQRLGVQITTRDAVAFEIEAKHPPDAPALFDLADFAAMYGLTGLVRPLLDMALERDPNVLAVVRERRAERFADRFLYFLATGRGPEARLILERLRADMNGTQALARLRDPEVADGYEKVVGEPYPERSPDMAAATASPSPPQPAPRGPTSPPEPSPPQNPPSAAPPDVADPLPEAATLVREADELLAQARQAIRRSDPVTNPEAASAENRRAMRLLQDAARKYDRAAELYEQAGFRVPARVLENQREAIMLLSMCRKRA